jgi:hypothetical protein
VLTIVSRIPRKLPRYKERSPAYIISNTSLPNISRKRKLAAVIPSATTKRTKTTLVAITKLVSGVTSQEAVLRFLSLVEKSRDYDIPLRT